MNRNPFFDKWFFYELEKKCCSIEWWVKSKSYILIIGSLNLSDMYSVFITIKSYSASRSVFSIFFSLISYHKGILSIQKHLRWESRDSKFSRSRMKSSENFHHQSSAIDYRTGFIVRNNYKFLEVWYVNMVEWLPSIFISRIVSYFSLSVKYIYVSFGIKGRVSHHRSAVLTVRSVTTTNI